MSSINIVPLTDGTIIDWYPKSTIAHIDEEGVMRLTPEGEKLISYHDLEWELWRSFLAADIEHQIFGTDWSQEDYPDRYILFFKKSGYWKQDE